MARSNVRTSGAARGGTDSKQGRASRSSREKAAPVPAVVTRPPQKKEPGDPARYVEPMKALSGPPIVGDNWLLEVKYDGYRALTVFQEGRAELWSRNEKPLTADYPELAAALQRLRCRSAVLDGEVVALDEGGHPRFQLLQGLETGRNRPPIFYYVFDLLHLDGASLLGEPIEVRRKKLETLIQNTDPRIRLSPTFSVSPEELMESVRQQGLEGIIGKRRGSLYEPGQRSGAWLKQRLVLDQEFVIGGYTPPKGGRRHFGALLVGYYRGTDLIYAGKVGAGFTSRSLSALHKRFSEVEEKTCPFVNLPGPKPRFGSGMTATAMREVTWLRPELVGQVKFSEWTREGMLRQPVFLGLREDKRARDVVREGASS